ncbi:hypothetical protein LCGC14_2370460 [marine sediment metagenome]|uniref:Copper resistance protein D domain-containing protein n=1 Tax=marine sediment metagenome TaxID=412755 RepID=A0A0F9EYL0_9ZZZZ|nr:hypothetical protein [Methylophaga sp.]
MIFAIALHLLSSVIWVGGMFFAYMALRPVASSLLETPVRLTLWSQVLQRFFPWVWASIIILLASGLWMIIKHFGGMAAVGVHIHIMLTLGLVMMLMFMHIVFSPYKKLQRAVDANQWEAGGKALNQIRKLIAINLSLGLIVIIVASAGRYI